MALKVCVLLRQNSNYSSRFLKDTRIGIYHQNQHSHEATSAPSARINVH